MSQVLDLSITFTPPPARTDPDVLATIALNYGDSGLSYAGDVLHDPLSKQEREDLRWYLEEIGAAQTCNQLGQVADFTHHLEEARGWFQRAVALSEQADPTRGEHATHLSNLAKFLVRKAQARTVQEVSLQLEEARQYAEQALAIRQVLRSPELWMTFSILADITDMQGHHEVAQAYRQEEREAYASFAGNRNWID